MCSRNRRRTAISVSYGSNSTLLTTPHSVRNVQLNISHRPERARLTHSVPHMADSRFRSVRGYPWLFRVRGIRNSSFRPVSHPWPCSCDAPFPRTGPGGPGSPPSSVLCGATTPCTASLRFIDSPAGTTPCLLVRSRSPAGRGGPGPFVSASGPSGHLAWTVQGIPGSLASHPVAMRTFSDPGRPVAPRLWRRFRCCPRNYKNEGVDIEDFEAQ